ncbi:alkaline phosphatase D family protein [Cerasicoccus maritimus]|uniref:alkaline phosphatase D family protein n=1 Tax=Cerasicoccus maritimus TaxID=490089 RepID=UPI002852B8E4|nr:alkaline phosphatase D family protein [Cerasicoccus maritimus]
MKLWDSSPDEWQVSVLVGLEAKQTSSLSFSIPGDSSEASATFEYVAKRFRDVKGVRSDLYFYRKVIKVPLHERYTKVAYRVGNDGESFEFHVPQKGQMPHIAYGSCNGFHDPKLLKKQLGAKNASGETEAGAMWTKLAKQHKQSATRFNLLVLGGDQVYSDISLDRFEDDVLDWSWFTSTKKQKATKVTKEIEGQLHSLYTNLYCDSWIGNVPMMRVMATCPTLMMWDDHDIMDGWGSYENGRERWDIYAKGVYPAARDAFLLFQQHCKPGQAPARRLAEVGESNLSEVHVLGDLVIAHLDTRSERKPEQVMSKRSWFALNEYLNSLDGVKHLFLCVSVPVAYADFESIENILLKIPGDQGVEDDLRDHWRSEPHRITREKMLKSLFRFSREKQCRVTIISGDVHVAAHGVIELFDGESNFQRTNRIHQLVSSPIMNKAGNPLVNLILAWQGSSEEVINTSIRARMLPLRWGDVMAPKSRPYVWERNWLSLRPEKDTGAYRAEWHIEHSDYPCREEIHAVQLAL